MDDLRRELAPIPSAAWDVIDEEARSALKVTLAARKLVDFSGPHGWTHSAVEVGRTEPLREAPGDGVSAARRRLQPLIELRAPFALARAELDAVARGAKDPNFDALTAAARAIAVAEDRAVFQGFEAGGIVGIVEAAADAALTITEDYEAYPAQVAKAVGLLKSAGVDGPYAIALGPRCYTGLTQTTMKGGYPAIQHVQRLLDGPIVWAPAVNGAVVLSLRGGDFELTVGRDLSIGYLGHTTDSVELYIEESLTFRVLAAEAAVPLLYRAARRGDSKR
jgi:uncharacterized linocin/CFP29 family protein